MTMTTHLTPWSILPLSLATALTYGCKTECGGGLEEVCYTSTGIASGTSSGTTETSTTTSGPGTSTTTGVNTTTATSTDPTEASTTQTSSSTTGPMPTCGDNKTDAGEECDNGPDNADDAACTSTCTLAWCGDNLTQTGVEECDNGPDNADDAACTSTCTLAKCGDSLTQKDIEECDDGNSAPHDGCSDDCYIERLVFVSSSLHTGNSSGLNGLAGADTICQTLAEKASLTDKTFLAWLSVNGGPNNIPPAQSPSTRFPEAVTTAKGPFLLPDKDHTVVAESWADLTDGTLDHAIDYDEFGSALGSASAVWTSTNTQGGPATKDNCSAWALDPINSMTKGGTGVSNAVAGSWTDDDESKCINSARLYCFQVAP
ncbi:MAG TPA: DUF4215 domain-containing protein [Nannocystaceae bacterium]|nr:DUF4215 domain-containing protein [Nannocystaceae bacterium]